MPHFKIKIPLFPFFICFLFSCSAQEKSVEKLILKQGERLIIVRHESATYLQTHKAGGANPPVYECRCKTSGECELRWIETSEVICYGSKTCPTGTPGEISGCGFVKVKSALPPQVQAELNGRRFILEEFKEQTTFNQEGYRFITPWQIELKQKPAHTYKDTNGATVYELAAGGPKIRCGCDCESGSCDTFGGSGDTNLICAGTCAMLPNGNPCKGCAFSLLPGK